MTWSKRSASSADHGDPPRRRLARRATRASARSNSPRGRALRRTRRHRRATHRVGPVRSPIDHDRDVPRVGMLLELPERRLVPLGVLGDQHRLGPVLAREAEAGAAPRSATIALAPCARTSSTSLRDPRASPSITSITRSPGPSRVLSSAIGPSCGTAAGWARCRVRSRPSTGASAMVSIRGRNSEKLLPCPIWESTWISPPSSRAISREIDSPRPVPPYLREVVPSACWNASKIRYSLSSGIPTPGIGDREPDHPLGLARARRCATPERSCRYPIDSVTPPSWVNLNAFESRFLSTCPRRCSSEMTDPGNSGSISTANDRPFCSATCRNARSASRYTSDQRDRREIELHPPRLNLRQIQNVVDQRQQIVPRRMDRPGELDLPVGQRALLILGQQPAQDQHRVQRRPQLVRHVRQELRLVLRGQRQLRGLLLQTTARELDLLILDLDVPVLLRQQRRLLLQLIVGLAQLLGLLLQLLRQTLGLREQRRWCRGRRSVSASEYSRRCWRSRASMPSSPTSGSASSTRPGRSTADAAISSPTHERQRVGDVQPQHRELAGRRDAFGEPGATQAGAGIERDLGCECEQQQRPAVPREVLSSEQRPARAPDRARRSCPRSAPAAASALAARAPRRATDQRPSTPRRSTARTALAGRTTSARTRAA